MSQRQQKLFKNHKDRSWKLEPSWNPKIHLPKVEVISSKVIGKMLGRDPILETMNMMIDVRTQAFRLLFFDLHFFWNIKLISF
jgi:hypothetical protein